MTKKKIDAQRIKSITADLSNLNEDINAGVDFVEDGSKTYFENGNTAITNTTANIKETISNLNDYLNKVADAFEKTDAALAADVSALEDFDNKPQGDVTKTTSYEQVSTY